MPESNVGGSWHNPSKQSWCELAGSTVLTHDDERNEDNIVLVNPLVHNCDNVAYACDSALSWLCCTLKTACCHYSCSTSVCFLTLLSGSYPSRLAGFFVAGCQATLNKANRTCIRYATACSSCAMSIQQIIPQQTRVLTNREILSGS